MKRFYGDYKLPKEDWPPRVSDRYVNLALINHEKIPQLYEIDDFMKSTLHGTVDDLYFEKQTIALEQLFQPKQLLEHGSLQLRNTLLQSSINRQLEGIVQGLPSPRERVQQTDKLLHNLQGSLPLNHAVLASLLQLVTQPSISSVSNVKGLKVLLDGAPGVGKTTFCHSACKDWADGKIFADFKLMVYVPLRDDQVANGKQIEDLFCYGPKKLRERAARELEDTDGENALLVLDGWDELSPQQRGKKSLLCKIIIGRLLPRCSILITSRPYASQWLRKPDVTNRHVEIFGFTEQQVEQCIYNMLGQVAARALLEKLELRSDLKTLCYVPTNLAMVIYIYRSCTFDLPDTLTGIYDAFTTNALLRYLQEYDPSTEPTMHLRSRDALPTDILKMYRAMCLLAYHGLLEDKMVFSREDLEEYHSELTNSSNTLGLITAFKGFTETGIDLKYQFLHLTIQEFLAAEALSQEPPEVQTKFVVDHLHDDRYRTMFRFLFGKCGLDSMEVVLRFLFLTSINGRDCDRLLFLCHLLYEANDPEFYKAVGRSIPCADIRLKFPDDVSLFDTLVIGKFLSHASMHVKCLDLYDNDLTRQKLALLTENVDESSNVTIDDLKLETRGCSINEVTPFLQHSVFSKVVSMRINFPTDPHIAAMFCSTIATMPKLTKVELFLRPPTVVDKAFLSSATENVYLAIIKVFAELAQNPIINDLRLFLTSTTMPKLLDDASAVALTEMIQKRIIPLTLKIDVGLFGIGFMKTFCSYVATPSKIKELHISDRLPSFNSSKNTDDGRMTASKTQVLFDGLKMNKSIDFLELNGCKQMFTDSTAVVALEEMLCTNSTLCSLHLKNCKITTTVAGSLSKALQFNTSLTDLTLHGVEEGVSVILSSLATSPCTIDTLSLQECHISSTDEPSITAILVHNTLKCLDLTSNYLGPEAAINLFSTLKENTSLEKLVLSHSKCLDEGDAEALSAAIVTALSNNHTLKVLKLDECSLPHPVVEAVATSLTGGSRLEVLDLARSKVSVYGLQKLFVALQSNNNLTKLTLRDNISLDSVTAGELNRMIALNTTLTTLTIKFNSVFNETCTPKDFLKALHANSMLTNLGINGLNVAEFDGVNLDRIKKRMAIITVNTR